MNGEHAHAWQYAERLAGFDVLLVCSCGELLRKTIPDPSVVDLGALLDATDDLPEDAPPGDGYSNGWRERRMAIEAAGAIRR